MNVLTTFFYLCLSKTHFMETTSPSPWAVGIKYGIILGLIAVIYLLMLYLIDTQMMFGWWGLLLLPIAIAVLVIGGKERRKELGGAISFKEALKTCFMISVIYGVFYVLFEYLLYNVIDPNLTTMVKEYSIEQSVKWMEKFGTPQDQIDKMISKMEKEDYGMTLKNTVWAFAFVCIFGFILSAIVAAIIKKKPVEA